jgi:cellulose synthase operon protein C
MILAHGPTMPEREAMARLAEGLSRFFGRVEIFARGADDDRRAAEEALRRGHHLEARAHARALLARVPASPLGLALWAEAADALRLDDEVVEALTALAEQVPWRQEIWLRLGLAAAPVGRTDALERAAAGDDPALSREALLALADLDIQGIEPARAERWLERVPSHPSQPDPELALRRAECALSLGRLDEARRHADAMAGIDGERRGSVGRNAPPLSGRVRLVEARLAQRWPHEARGGDPLMMALGAMLLEAPGADDLVAELLAECHDAALVDRVRRALRELGVAHEARWVAAFALAEGRRDDARRALLEAAARGDAVAAATLLHHAVRWRDLEAVRALAEHHPLGEDLRRIVAAADHRAADRDDLALDALGDDPWAQALRDEIVAAWFPEVGEARWDAVLRELRRAASALSREDLVGPIEALAVERRRPLFVAVLGEFNAGKSTLLNALLGTDVAPTGILPTTASLHWVAWAPDPFARIEVVGESDRVVAHADLKATLRALQGRGARIGRVYIYAPIERLKRIEVLDTPGFNAPDESHAAEARRGIEEAHLALWLLDATAPLKDSERRVIAEIVRAEVPIQVLVNKRDRVSDIDRVMTYLDESLAEVGIASLEAPIALSARLALEGRMGDAAALEASHWQAVETFLSDHVVDRADTLRERALRRKAHQIAAALAEESAALSERKAHARTAEREALAARRALAGRLASHRMALASAMAEALDPALRRLALDTRPIAALDEVRRAHPEVRSYLVDRTVERLAEPLVNEVALVARRHDLEGGFDRAIVRPTIRATLAGAAAAAPGLHLTGESLRASVEASLGRVAEILDATAGAGEHRPGSEPQHRIYALAEALRSDRKTPDATAR